LKYSTYVSMLSRVEIFAGAGDDFLEALIPNLKAQVVVPGDSVIKAGNIGYEMYFVMDGQLEVVDQWGKVVDQIGRGHIFGEVALLMSRPRTASIRALDWCTLLMLTREDLENTLEHFPEVAHKIRTIATQRAQTRTFQTVQMQRSLTQTQTNPQDAEDFSARVGLLVSREPSDEDPDAPHPTIDVDVIPEDAQSDAGSSWQHYTTPPSTHPDALPSTDFPSPRSRSSSPPQDSSHKPRRRRPALDLVSPGVAEPSVAPHDSTSSRKKFMKHTGPSRWPSGSKTPKNAGKTPRSNSSTGLWSLPSRSLASSPGSVVSEAWTGHHDVSSPSHTANNMDDNPATPVSTSGFESDEMGARGHGSQRGSQGEPPRAGATTNHSHSTLGRKTVAFDCRVGDGVGDASVNDDNVSLLPDPIDAIPRQGSLPTVTTHLHDEQRVVNSSSEADNNITGGTASTERSHRPAGLMPNAPATNQPFPMPSPMHRGQSGVGDLTKQTPLTSLADRILMAARAPHHPKHELAGTYRGPTPGGANPLLLRKTTDIDQSTSVRAETHAFWKNIGAPRVRIVNENGRYRLEK